MLFTNITGALYKKNKNTDNGESTCINDQTYTSLIDNLKWLYNTAIKMGL